LFKAIKLIISVLSITWGIFLLIGWIEMILTATEIGIVSGPHYGALQFLPILAIPPFVLGIRGLLRVIARSKSNIQRTKAFRVITSRWTTVLIFVLPIFLTIPLFTSGLIPSGEKVRNKIELQHNATKLSISAFVEQCEKNKVKNVDDKKSICDQSLKAIAYYLAEQSKSHVMFTNSKIIPTETDLKCYANGFSDTYIKYFEIDGPKRFVFSVYSPLEGELCNGKMLHDLIYYHPSN